MTIDKRRFRHRRAAALAINAAWRGARRLVTLSVTDGVVHIRRKPKAISRLINRMGFLIHLTNDPDLTRDDVLLLYARRDRVEKLFDVLKNELRDNRLRVSSRDAVEGRIFVAFLALMVHTLLA